MKKALYASVLGLISAASVGLNAPAWCKEADSQEYAEPQAPQVLRRLPNSHAGTRYVDGMTVRTNPDGTVEVTEPAYNYEGNVPLHRAPAVHRSPAPQRRPHIAATRTPPPAPSSPRKPMSSTKSNAAIDSYINKYKPFVQSLDKSAPGKIGSASGEFKGNNQPK